MCLHRPALCWGRSRHGLGATEQMMKVSSSSPSWDSFACRMEFSMLWKEPQPRPNLEGEVFVVQAKMLLQLLNMAVYPPPPSGNPFTKGSRAEAPFMILDSLFLTILRFSCDSPANVQTETLEQPMPCDELCFRAFV